MLQKDLQIDWLRAFIAVVDTGSVTAAARQVFRSQSAVSMQLKKLEESIGRPLLNRGTRQQMSLTPAGFDLLGYARKMLELHSNALVAMHGGSVSGRVSIGVPDDYAQAYLAPVLRTFSSRFNDVEVTLLCEPSIALLARLERGEVDLAVMTRDTPNRGELLFRESLIWVASEQHEVWKRDPLPIAVHGIDGRLRSAVITAISAKQRDYRVVYNSPNVLGQLAAAESGMAVAAITRCCVPPGLKVLDTRNGLPELPELEVALVRSKRSKRSVAVDVMHTQVTRSLKMQT
ncbi:LysR family transcriptional regulator [Burkholderia sp. Nafp2/4-1b]|uniref:LysR family transcriptional regulator n=1 Tax=Burkholderia sp. Nafp2/4-1b TaxID=2116686 RepID=UPI000EF8919A|nr:LysR family transcriptional regulator [Burkholderia sp. Nafp2/4-1b]RKT99052.1 LysR family transcriptional regulator [Burkholderia sp. Nafp2/4-1b]